MKKYLGITAAISSYFLLAQSALANTNIPLGPPSQIEEVANIPIENIPQYIITLLFLVALIIAIVFLIYGGITWILSGGDEKQVEAARNHIVAAIIGIIVVMGSFLILNIVFLLLTGNTLDLGNVCIPTLENPTCTPPTTSEDSR